MQCFEGKLLFEFDRTRMFRSGLVGFTLHGSLSHYYYQFCEVIVVFFPFKTEQLVVSCSLVFSIFLFRSIYFQWLAEKKCSQRLAEIVYFFFQALIPFQDWWVVPAKVAFDQTVWAAVWNSIYFVALGLLRFESPTNIFKELKATFLPMLTVRNSSSTFFFYQF